MRAQEALAGSVHHPGDCLVSSTLVGRATSRAGQATAERLPAGKERADRACRGPERAALARRRRRPVLHLGRRQPCSLEYLIRKPNRDHPAIIKDHPAKPEDRGYLISAGSA